MQQSTCSMNLSYLQALLANLFFSFRDFVLSCKKLLFWNNLGSRMVSDRPILAFKVDLFFQSFRLRWWWKSEKSGFAEDLTENFQFLVSWKWKMAPIFCFSHLVGKGTSLTGVKEFISLFNFSSSFPAREENYDDKCFQKSDRLTNCRQLLRICCKIVAVSPSSFSAANIFNL